jgi:conjugative transfer signal peptidase TraF
MSAVPRKSSSRGRLVRALARSRSLPAVRAGSPPRSTFRRLAENLSVEQNPALAETRRRPQSGRLRRAVRILFTAGAITVGLSLAGRQLAARLTVNVTTSMPRGIYWLRPDRRAALHSTVALAIPSRVRQLVDERRYLPPGFRLLKSVVAVAGDVVCLEHQRYSVNGLLVSVVATTDQAGRPLPPLYPFCGVVPDGVAFLAAAGASSLDSRFFGPVPISDLTPAAALWTY